MKFVKAYPHNPVNLVAKYVAKIRWVSEEPT